MAKFTLALFESTYGSPIILEKRYAPDEYVRLSEFIDIELPERVTEEVLNDKLDVLDKAETELRAKYQVELENIKTKRQELLAITYQPEKEAI
jgi:hypothetical protein